MTDWLDLALVYDPATRRCDLVLGDDGDLALDETPATPMLVSLLTDRRARAEDTLPDGTVAGAAPAAAIGARRGWAGDALDAFGRRIGSRLWLLARAKGGDLTPRFAAEWTREAFGWVRDETGTAAVVAAEWLRRGWLAIAVTVDGRTVTVNQRIG